MGFRNFKLICSVRAIIMTATVVLLVYVAMSTTLYATMVILTALVAYQTWGLIHFVDRSNRDLARFLLSIRHSDFAATFPDDGKGGSHSELRLAFEAVIRDFKTTRSDKEEHFRYLQTVVQHIGVGLVAFGTDGRIELMNNAAKKLLGLPRARNIEEFAQFGPTLLDKLEELRSGQRALLRLEIRSEMMQLSLAATEFRLGQRGIKLVSLQNITGELAEREMEAWQQLVRVLTHEIMNSVTPIASLATTTRSMLDGPTPGDTAASSPALSAEDHEDLVRAVSTIERRSEGLLHFVDAYRTLTRIPRPKFQIVPVWEMLDRIRQLTLSRPDIGHVSVTIEVEPKSLEVTADPDLVEQVLINLTTNAVQAQNGTSEGSIRMTSRINEAGHVIIQVADSGPGISEEVKESIFVPFFTTKTDGTGIGLSLSRQIMRLHKGEISVSSEPGQGTRFTLRF